MRPEVFQAVLADIKRQTEGETYEVSLQVGNEVYSGPLLTMNVKGNPTGLVLISAPAGRDNEDKCIYVSVYSIDAMWVNS